MTKPQYPSEKLDQYMLRFPDGMRDRIKDEAAKNNRSMNAEIIARLEASFEEGSTASMTAEWINAEILRINEEIESLKRDVADEKALPRDD